MTYSHLMLINHAHYDLLDVLDQEVSFAWAEAALYDEDDCRDYAEEAYNEMLMAGGDL